VKAEKSRGTLNIEYHSAPAPFPYTGSRLLLRRPERGEGAAPRNVPGEFRIAIEDRLQLVTIERVRRAVFRRADGMVNSFPDPSTASDSDWAGLISQHCPRWLSSSVESHNAMYALLHDASALVSDVRAVSSVAEENQSADIFLLAKDAVVFRAKLRCGRASPSAVPACRHIQDGKLRRFLLVDGHRAGERCEHICRLLDRRSHIETRTPWSQRSGTGEKSWRDRAWLGADCARGGAPKERRSNFHERAAVQCRRWRLPATAPETSATRFDRMPAQEDSPTRSELR